MTKSTLRRIKKLFPKTEYLAEEFIDRANNWLKANGWGKYTCEITQGKRSIYEQAGYYSIGRRFDRKKKKWVNIPGRKRITWTLDSNHLSGMAFDIALYSNKKYYWPNPKIKKNKIMWMTLAYIGKDLGLYPGAFWKKKKDYLHYSIVPG